MKKTILLAAALFLALNTKAQKKESYIESLNKPNLWVDSVFKKLSNKEKIGQLFMVAAYTNKDQKFIDSIGVVIKKQGIGGLVFFQGGPGRQAVLTNKYQSLAKVPLMIAIDGEWGLGMRLDSTISFPYQMTLGAIQDNNLIYKMGLEVAKDVKRLGMHINFAPSIDVNNNAANPVIGFRSFGENKENVANKGVAYIRGMQDGGIITTAKHFPGHGDTNVDSHYDLPQLNFTKERLDSLEMYPFKKAIAANLSGAMVAHMNIPSLDNTPNIPSTLSKPIITGILKQELGFKGLIFTDAMNMKGAVKFFPNGEADVKALIAGNDVIELSENTERAILAVKKAIAKKQITWDEIDAKVKKVLYAKYWMGLDDLKAVNIDNINIDLNRAESKTLIQQMTDAAVTVLKDASFPLRNDFVKKTAIVNIGGNENTIFSNIVKRLHGKATSFAVSKTAVDTDLVNLKNQLKGFDQIILAIHDSRTRPAATLDYTDAVKNLIRDFSSVNSVAVVFANPYTVATLPGIEKSKSIIIGYQNTNEMQISAAKVMIGTLKAKGKLPVTINKSFKYGDGVMVK